MIRKVLLILGLSFTASALASVPSLNMAYVEVNDNHLANVGCYVRADTKQPLIDIAAIFAANINGDSPNHPQIFFNEHVENILNHPNEIQELHAKGIKVLMTFLGNHHAAGWSCMTDERAIQQLASQMVKVINDYQLDGIDIDDEYSRCSSNNTSMIRLAKAIKTHPDFKGKLLTKALFQDETYFKARYQGNVLADFLDMGWEMSYGSSAFHYRLSKYLNFKMLKSQLYLGVSTEQDEENLLLATKFVMENEFAGMMIYNLKNNSFAFLNVLANIQHGVGVEVLPNCLR